MHATLNNISRAFEHPYLAVILKPPFKLRFKLVFKTQFGLPNRFVNIAAGTYF